MASIFQRGKRGIWWIKYYAQGRQVYHTLGTTNARVAGRIRKQIEGEEASGTLLAPTKTPLADLVEDFCRFLKTARTRKSCVNDYSVIRVFFGPICPSLQLGSRVNRCWRHGEPRSVKDTKAKIHVKAQYLEEITGGVIESFITRRIAEDGISPKTANRCREVLHRVFNYAGRR